MKCPECNHDLRRVNSLVIDLCDQCGYRQSFEPPPTPPTKPRKSTQTRNTEIAIKIAGFSLLGLIAVWGVSKAIANAKTAQLEREIEAKKAEVEAIIAAEEAKNIDISELPATCQPTDYVKMDIDIVNNCLKEGLTPLQLSEIAGQLGQVTARNDNVEIRTYPETYGTGSLMVTFVDGRLDSYAQSGFSPSPPIHRTK